MSKLVIIAVMLRGRHRGLPVAVDRAGAYEIFFSSLSCSQSYDLVILPQEYKKTEEANTMISTAEKEA